MNFFAQFDKVAASAATSLALLSPYQSRFANMTFQQVSSATTFLSSHLTALKYQPGDVLVGDLPNVSENLLVQLACARVGVTYATVKDAAGLQALSKARGVVTTRPTAENYLWTAKLPLAPICLLADDATTPPMGALRLHDLLDKPASTVPIAWPYAASAPWVPPTICLLCIVSSSWRFCCRCPPGVFQFIYPSDPW